MEILGRRSSSAAAEGLVDWASRCFCSSSAARSAMKLRFAVPPPPLPLPLPLLPAGACESEGEAATVCAEGPAGEGVAASPPEPRRCSASRCLPANIAFVRSIICCASDDDEVEEATAGAMAPGESEEGEGAAAPAPASAPAGDSESEIESSLGALPPPPPAPCEACRRCSASFCRCANISFVCWIRCCAALSFCRTGPLAAAAAGAGLAAGVGAATTIGRKLAAAELLPLLAVAVAVTVALAPALAVGGFTLPLLAVGFASASRCFCTKRSFFCCTRRWASLIDADGAAASAPPDIAYHVPMLPSHDVKLARHCVPRATPFAATFSERHGAE